MKGLFIILVLVGTFNFANAQFYFEAKKMIKKYEEVEKIEEIEAKVFVDSDTTEITIKFKNATLKEKIGKLYHKQVSDIYKIFIYEKEKGEWIVLHFDADVLSSVVFQSEIRYLMFE